MGYHLVSETRPPRGEMKRGWPIGNVPGRVVDGRRGNDHAPVAPFPGQWRSSGAVCCKVAMHRTGISLSERCDDVSKKQMRNSWIAVHGKHIGIFRMAGSSPNRILFHVNVSATELPTAAAFQIGVHIAVKMTIFRCLSSLSSQLYMFLLILHGSSCYHRFTTIIWCYHTFTFHRENSSPTFNQKRSWEYHTR
jgi:hypothetical protein